MSLSVAFSAVSLLENFSQIHEHGSALPLSPLCVVDMVEHGPLGIL